MSGHNKWTQIKRQKGSEDQKRSKLFGVLARLISLEAKKAGGDRSAPGLRQAIEKARKANLPSDNIERAIKNALGGGAATYEEVLYECYGPGGAALILEGITDNKNRTSQEIKHLLDQHGAALAGAGAALWAFSKAPRADSGQVGTWQAVTRLELGETDPQTLAHIVDALQGVPGM